MSFYYGHGILLTWDEAWLNRLLKLVWSGTGGGGRQLLGTVEEGGTTRCRYSVSLPPGGRSAEWWWELLEDELSGARSFVPVANPTTEGTDGICCKEKEYIVLRVTKINAHKLYVIHEEIWPSFYEHMLLDKRKFFKFSLWKQTPIIGVLSSGI